MVVQLEYQIGFLYLSYFFFIIIFYQSGCADCIYYLSGMNELVLCMCELYVILRTQKNTKWEQ